MKATLILLGLLSVGLSGAAAAANKKDEKKCETNPYLCQKKPGPASCPPGYHWAVTVQDYENPNWKGACVLTNGSGPK